MKKYPNDQNKANVTPINKKITRIDNCWKNICLNEKIACIIELNNKTLTCFLSLLFAIVK